LQEHKIAAEIVEVGCVGYCQRELFVDVQKPGEPRLAYADINLGNIDQLLEAVFVRGECATASSTAATATPARVGRRAEINTTDFFKKQVKVVLRNAGVIDPAHSRRSAGRRGFCAAPRRFAR
jgi:hypothetical protein